MGLRNWILGKKIYPSQRNARVVKISASSDSYARARDRIICFGIDDGPKMVRRKRAKNRCGAGNARSRVDRPLYLDCVASPLLSAPVFQAAAHRRRRSTFSFDRRIARVRRKKAELCASTRPCFTTANRGARIFDEVHGPKNVPPHRGRFNFQKKKKKKKIAFPSPCVKRIRRKRA